MKASNFWQKGFTLVELLIAIAIIAILTGIVVSNLTSSRAKARDAKRVSDLNQIQLAMELYFDRCKEYPGPQIGSNAARLDLNPVSLDWECTANGQIVKFGSYLSKMPTPPLSTDRYDYVVNNMNRVTRYYLHTKLETENEVVKDGPALAPITVNPAVPCSDQPANKDYCLDSN